ncbi:MAG: histidine kinase [Opitutus sp.]|nr:histidine kinase [Opitutus sp.]MCS6273973.1 histidine kinase [Opitutus sp.]
MVARFAFPIYAVLIAASHALAYHEKSMERERRALLAEARAAESRLMALQMQLNPHFLFNSLNAVSSLIHENPRQADAMLCSVCDLLRSVLDSGERREVTLAEELALVERYLDIQRIRFADRLTLKLEINPDTLTAAVPTLLLQPLVENAIVHGIAPHTRPGLVTLRARLHGHRLHLEVADDGPGAQTQHHLDPRPTPSASSVASSGSIGLNNTRNRLAALYGDDHSFSLKTGPGGALATVELPLRAVAV